MPWREARPRSPARCGRAAGSRPEGAGCSGGPSRRSARRATGSPARTAFAAPHPVAARCGVARSGRDVGAGSGAACSVGPWPFLRCAWLDPIRANALGAPRAGVSAGGAWRTPGAWLLADVLGVVCSGQQLIQLAGVLQAELDHPALAVGILVHQAGVALEGLVDLDDLTRHRAEQLGHRLDRLDGPEHLHTAEL